MSIDSALKRLKKLDEQYEEFKSSGKIESWEKFSDEAEVNFLLEWLTFLKFSENQREVFSRLCLANIDNFPNNDITLEEGLEIIYNSTIQTLILIPNKRR